MLGLGAVISTVTGIIGDHISDKAELKKANQEATDRVIEAFNEANMKQIEVNLKQAEHPDIFVSGARPFLMWVCGGAFAYAFILQPIFQDVLKAFMGEGSPVLTTLDVEEIKIVLMGLLGLGGLRSIEKVNGVARSSMGGTIAKGVGGFFKNRKRRRGEDKVS